MQQLFQDRLALWLTKAAQADSIHIKNIERMKGGAIQENWLVQLLAEGGPYSGVWDAVVRTDAPSAIFYSHGRAEEFSILKTVHQAGLIVPEPLWLCSDVSILGKPFYVMRRVVGSADPHAMVKGEISLHLDRIVIQLAQQLAKLHHIQLPQANLSFLTVPKQPALELCRQYRTSLDLVKMRPRPILEWSLHWLEMHALPSDKMALIHRDFRTGNFLADKEGLTAILDWEFAGWGDPYEDLGWFLCKSWRFGRPDRAAGGLAAGDLFIKAYQDAAKITLDPQRLDYWKVMALMRWSVIAIMQGERHWSGKEPSLELALTGRRLAETEADLLNLLKNIDKIS